MIAVIAAVVTVVVALYLPRLFPKYKPGTVVRATNIYYSREVEYLRHSSAIGYHKVRVLAGDPTFPEGCVLTVRTDELSAR